MEKKYYTVTNAATAKLLYQHVQDSEYLAFDTETNSLNVRKGKVIGFSVSGDTGIGFYFPVMIWNPVKQELEEAIVDGVGAHTLAKRIIAQMQGKKLIMHNASFDIRFTKNFYGIDLLPSLHADTALLVHTVKEEGAFGFGGKPFGLKEIAIMVQKEIGLDVQERANKEQIALKESIKKNGGSTTKDNYEIYKADLEILSEYAAADTDLTLRIYKHFIKQLEIEGLVDFFFNIEVMPLYREVTIPMEEKGIRLDIPLIQATKDEIDKDLEMYKKLVTDELLSKDKVRKWILDQATTEFPPSSKGTFGQTLVHLHGINLPKSDKTSKYILNKAVISALPDSNLKFFLLTGDTSFLTAMEIAKVSMHLWKQSNGDFFNIQSKDQMGKIAFDVLGIKPLSETTKGKPQFDDDMIQAISDKHTWAENLRIYNKLLKIKSAYVDRFLTSAEDGRFYPYFKQNGTVSGRYGSDLQQLPRPKEDGEAAEIIIKYTNQIRAFFVSDPGYLFIDCDYESLEPHLFASISDDKNLQEIFNTGYDFYSYVAIKTEKLEGVSADKKAPNFLKKLDAPKRNKAKAYSLGIAYGMSPYALAMSLGVPQKEGEALHAAYLEGFPGVASWITRSREFVKANGYIKNAVGRIRHLPVVKEVYGNMQDKIMDWRVRKELEAEYGTEVVTNLYRDYRNGLNNVLNFQIQSYAASVVNRAALAINREFKKRGWDGQVVAQIHDQLVMLVREDLAEEAAKVVKHLMETTTQPSGITLKAPPELAHNLRDGH
jgi:DNA polymerase I-like protein with 3'-5' exonuclease and polymerase domains